ncbi:hypothetical protein [Variovorax sp. LT1R16]|uniref:hypothetical protein n=1 Tax=Variovorax sp. LT1R16 TaxID=3443728 RepID=UPI003F45BE38
MADPRFNWLLAYNYQRRVARLQAGEVGLFRCTPAHNERLTSLIKAWATANPDKVSAAGLAHTGTERRGIRVAMAPAPDDWFTREPDHTWMPRIATYLPD